MVRDWGVDTLIARLRQVRGVEPEDADVHLSTVHKAKGLEWPHVRLAPDFSRPDGDWEDPTVWDDEEAHLLYVAVTRTRDRLDISDCEAAQFAWQTPGPDEEAELELESDEAALSPHPRAEPKAVTLELAPELAARLEQCAEEAGMSLERWLEHIASQTLEPDASPVEVSTRFSDIQF
jgi:ATP-dependent exoDNAse (exonuclease V) beta subunit